ncbi:MAG: hypothetical protein V2A74_13325, partial [bacterium]
MPSRNAGSVVLFAIGVIMLVGLEAQAIVPLEINHQGVVSVNGTPFTGTGEFRFALINSRPGFSWTNDGSGLDGGTTPTLPTAPVSLPVSNGFYSVRLGDKSLPNMVEIPSDVFTTGTVKLRVWFDDGVNGNQQLSPDYPLASAPYAFSAENALNAVNAIRATNAVNSLPSLFGRFGGNGGNGALSVSGTTNLGAVRREFTSMTVPLGATLVADQGWAYISVQGRCTIAGTIS